MTKAKQSERDEAIATLRETLKPGDTVYTILRHCSRSGMQRVIDLVVMDKGEPRSISLHAAKAMDDKMDLERCGIKANGCGMDMGFLLVYSLGRTLFSDGFAVVSESYCTKCQDRPGKDGLGRTCKGCGGKGIVTKPKMGRNGDMSGFDNDGGYALKHKWL